MNPRTEQEYFELCLTDPFRWGKYLNYFYIWFGDSGQVPFLKLNKEHLKNILLKRKNDPKYHGKVPAEVAVAVFDKLAKLLTTLEGL